MKLRSRTINRKDLNTPRGVSNKKVRDPNRKKQEKQEKKDDLVRMKSKYPGTCDNCKKAINIGDNIIWNTTSKRTIHKNCPPKAGAPAAPGVVVTSNSKLPTIQEIMRKLNDNSN